MDDSLPTTAEPTDDNVPRHRHFFCVRVLFLVPAMYVFYGMLGGDEPAYVFIALTR